MIEAIWAGEQSPDFNKAVERFVAGHIPGCDRGFGRCLALAVVNGNKLIAGVVYHNWSPETGAIEISAASVDPRWLTRPVLKAIFEYPFSKIGCQIVVARIAESNKRARRMWKAVGSQEYLIPRLRGRNEAEAIMVLTDDAWREFMH